MRIFNEEQCKEAEPVFQRRKTGTGACQQCVKCGSAFTKALFYRHRSRCQGDALNFSVPSTLDKISTTKESPAFLDLMSSLQNDDIGKMCREDPTIRLVGRRLLTKDISKVDKTWRSGRA